MQAKLTFKGKTISSSTDFRGNYFRGKASKNAMESFMPISREILDEDLQILRVTLAAISDDVRHYSATSGAALQEALERLNHAYKEFSRPSKPGTVNLS